MARKLLRVALLGLAVLAGPIGFPALAMAAGPSGEAGQSPSTVTVRSTRDPVDKSYRKMIRGMERFEREHALAPQASLRFQLLPRSRTVDMRGITLRIAGDSVSVPVTVGEDNTFVLPRNETALREDAAVLANRKTTSMTWRALEAGLVSNSSPLFGWISNVLDTPEGVCNSPDGNYLFFSERPVFSVTLRAGERVETLPFRMLYAGGEQTPAELEYCDCQVMLDRTYYVPIWDRSWPDDTLVEFEYMTAPPQETP